LTEQDQPPTPTGSGTETAPTVTPTQVTPAQVTPASTETAPANTIIPGTTIEVPNLGQQTAVKGGEVPKNIEAMIEKGGGETRF